MALIMSPNVKITEEKGVETIPVSSISKVKGLVKALE
jgi:hypothetical protein